MFTGLVAELTFPSPKSQLKLVDPLLKFVKDTVKAASPLVGLAMKFANGEEESMVRIPVALVAVWPSGFAMVMLREPIAAVGRTVRFNVTFVGLDQVTVFTVTSAPPTVAAI